MSTAVLYRSTSRGTIELSVTDRTAVRAEVARNDDWGREFRPVVPVAWAAKIRKMDETEARKERRRRAREMPMTDAGPDVNLEPTAAERDPVAIEARRSKLEAGAKRELPERDERPYPNAGRFFLLCAGDRAARERGTPANTAPGAAYTEGRGAG